MGRSQETPQTLQAIAVALDCSLEFEGMTLAEDTTYFGQRTWRSQVGTDLLWKSPRLGTNTHTIQRTASCQKRKRAKSSPQL